MALKTERELLELSAKACGIKNFRYHPEDQFLSSSIEYDDENDCTIVWAPHLSDGDNARMEAALGIDVEWYEDDVWSFGWIDKCAKTILVGEECERYKSHNNDRQAARRLASLRVAAAIGEATP